MPTPDPKRSDETPLIRAPEIAERVVEMGIEISCRYRESGLLAVVVLRGGFVFAADLLRALEPSLRVKVDFVAASSYGDGTVSSGRVELVKDIDLPVAGEHVLIVDDILETGRTLAGIRDLIRDRGAASVRIATLLYKEGKLEKSVSPDYVGFRIPDVFVVGYGLDHAQLFRNLRDIQVGTRAPIVDDDD